MSPYVVFVVRSIVIFHFFSLLIYSQSWKIPDSILVLDTIAAGEEPLAIQQNFKLARENLISMRQEMDVFELDKIHPRLADLYCQYDLMYLWAGRLGGETASGFQSTLAKIKKRTEEIHQLFDMGEMQASQIKIIELQYHFNAEEKQLARFSEAVQDP